MRQASTPVSRSVESNMWNKYFRRIHSRNSTWSTTLGTSIFFLPHQTLCLNFRTFSSFSNVCLIILVQALPCKFPVCRRNTFSGSESLEVIPSVIYARNQLFSIHRPVTHIFENDSSDTLYKQRNSLDSGFNSKL